MKLRIYAGLVFALILTICLAGPPPANAFSLFNRDVKKAKEFMAAGMYPQAIELLQKRINDKPSDAEAHFQLGVCYIRTGNLGGADERFASAVRLKPDYGYQIGGEYKKAGSEALSRGRVNTALRLFRKAVAYQPALKSQVAKECFSAGKSCLDRWESNAADRCFEMAQQYDPGLAPQVKEVTTAYGRKLLRVAKGKPKSQRKRYIEEARKYLSKKEIEAVFPPPSWKTVWGPKTYVGVGYTGGDDPDYNDGGIFTVPGKETVAGDKIVIKGNNFEVWHNNRWQKCQEKFEDIYNHGGGKGYFTVRAPKGVKFTVEIQRLMEVE